MEMEGSGGYFCQNIFRKRRMRRVFHPLNTCTCHTIYYGETDLDLEKNLHTSHMALGIGKV
jgi:hypothetical protein